jgi:hypothetical protein
MGHLLQIIYLGSHRIISPDSSPSNSLRFVAPKLALKCIGRRITDSVARLKLRLGE